MALATTEDFNSVEPFGIVMPPEDKNASLLPRRIDGHFVLFHRPVSVRQRPRRRVAVALEGPAVVDDARAGDAVASGPWWDATRIGMGPPPIETPHGWLVVYHGVKQMVATSIYRVGLVLLDLDNPTKVLRRTPQLGAGPRRVVRAGRRRAERGLPDRSRPRRADTDELRLYYGAADSCIAMASANWSAVLDYLLSLPPEE